MPLHISNNATVFRKELLEKLRKFPEDELWTTLADFSEVHSLLLCVYILFIQKNRNNGTLRILKRSWNHRQVNFEAGLFFFDKIVFEETYIHPTVSKSEQIATMLQQEFLPPKPLEGIMLDGSDYVLTLHPAQNTYLFRHPSQLTGNFQEFQECIMDLHNCHA